jgi:hypothetical protein
MKNSILSIIAVTLLIPVMVARAAPAAAVVTFKMAQNVKILAADNSALTLAGLKVGERVGIAYQENNGVAVAQKIRVIVPKKADAGKSKVGKGRVKPDVFLHARGVITAVNTAEGTLTTNVHAARVKR